MICRHRRLLVSAVAIAVAPQQVQLDPEISCQSRLAYPQSMASGLFL